MLPSMRTMGYVALDHGRPWFDSSGTLCKPWYLNSAMVTVVHKLGHDVAWFGSDHGLLLLTMVCVVAQTRPWSFPSLAFDLHFPIPLSLAFSTFSPSIPTSSN